MIEAGTHELRNEDSSTVQPSGFCLICDVPSPMRSFTLAYATRSTINGGGVGRFGARR